MEQATANRARAQPAARAIRVPDIDASSPGAGGRQHSGQRTADGGQQTADSRQQTADSRQLTARGGRRGLQCHVTDGPPADGRACTIGDATGWSGRNGEAEDRPRELGDAGGKVPRGHRPRGSPAARRTAVKNVVDDARRTRTKRRRRERGTRAGESASLDASSGGTRSPPAWQSGEQERRPRPIPRFQACFRMQPVRSSRLFIANEDYLAPISWMRLSCAPAAGAPVGARTVSSRRICDFDPIPGESGGDPRQRDPAVRSRIRLACRRLEYCLAHLDSFPRASRSGTRHHHDLRQPSHRRRSRTAIAPAWSCR